MFKILFIGGLIAVLIFFIVRRLGMLGKSSRATTYIPASDWIEIGLDNRSMRKVVKLTMTTVFIGFVLLIIILLITAKFRLALIMLPISFYLIGQYFVLMNQLKAFRSQQILFNPHTQDCKVRASAGDDHVFNLQSGELNVRAVNAIQKNNGILFGYYIIIVSGKELVIPFVLNQNINNNPFFSKLESLSKNRVSKLFPII